MHVRASGIAAGMQVRAGGLTLTTIAHDDELTCVLPHSLLLPKGSGETAEPITVQVLDAQGREVSEPTILTLDPVYRWDSSEVPLPLDTAVVDRQVLPLPAGPVVVLGRNASKEVWGTVSTDAGITWSEARLLRQGSTAGGDAAYVVHPTAGLVAFTATAGTIAVSSLLGADGGSPTTTGSTVPLAAGTGVIDLSAYVDPVGGLHLAILEGLPGEWHYGLQYLYSTDGGVSWADSRMIFDSENMVYYTPSKVKIAGADGHGRICLRYWGTHSQISFHGYCDQWASHDGGLTWSEKSILYGFNNGSVLTQTGTLLLGSYSVSPMVRFGEWYTAQLERGIDWENDWETLRFLGSDWDENSWSMIAGLAGDRWDNVLIGAIYNVNSNDRSQHSRSFCRSIDGCATWIRGGDWPASAAMKFCDGKLTLDSRGNAFLLFPDKLSSSALSLYRAPAWSD